MIFNLNKIQKIIKKNSEIGFLFLLIVVTVASTTFYNNQKKIINENYRDVINNVYFQKSITHIINALSPKYKGVDHKINKGETFNKILKSYDVPDGEIIKIQKILENDYNLNSLKTNQIIKFVINEVNKEIVNFIFPVSRTKKIKLTRDLETNQFKKK